MKLDTIKQITEAFSDERAARDYFEAERWAGLVICPYCGSEKYYSFKARPEDKQNRYKCAAKPCRKKFNCLTGTIFEDSKIPMREWYKAMYLITSHKKGISSHQLGRDLGVCQKTAWFMLHRIREMLKDKYPQALDNHVEIDETYVGGKVGNKHAKQRKAIADSGKDNKTAVLGMVERGGNVILIPLQNTEGATMLPIIFNNIEKSATVITDGHTAYKNLGWIYSTHGAVIHSKGEYVRDNFHTNNIEGFFSQLKRGIYGIYHWVSPKHLDNYCIEFAFRYNKRKDTQTNRFNTALYQAGVRLKYRDLIGKGKEVKNDIK
jgi:transposase-like protein